MNLGENIYTFRTARNMSQGDLAEALDVSRQSVSKWENSSAVPELDKLLRMSRLFEVTLDELVNGKREKPPQTLSQTLSAPMRPLPPTRVMTGAVVLLFGMVFLLLSIFWGDRLSVGEEIGELASIMIVLVGVSLMTTFNRYALTVCSIIYFLYALMSYKLLNVNTITNHLFLGAAGLVLFAWFLIWCHKMDLEQRQERQANLASDH
ncbi:MAG: helix-turn-helix transcriptional regulator [Clostridia bacterium]|nr:helix-turn-helix transcriptional regulator [Clostridia bacterium]